MQFRSVLLVASTVTVLAAALWGVAAAGNDPDGRVMQLDRSGAATVTVIAAMCWLARWLDRRDERRRREYRRREAALIRSAAKLDVATTKPLPRLHSVRHP